MEKWRWFGMEVIAQVFKRLNMDMNGFIFNYVVIKILQ